MPENYKIGIDVSIKYDVGAVAIQHIIKSDFSHYLELCAGDCQGATIPAPESRKEVPMNDKLSERELHILESMPYNVFFDYAKENGTIFNCLPVVWIQACCLRVLRVGLVFTLGLLMKKVFSIEMI